MELLQSTTQNLDTHKQYPMNHSGTNEKYTKDQVLSMLYHFEKKAAEAYAGAQKKITDKLAKHEIPLTEYTAYAISKDQPTSPA